MVSFICSYSTHNLSISAQVGQIKLRTEGVAIVMAMPCALRAVQDIAVVPTKQPWPDPDFCAGGVRWVRRSGNPGGPCAFGIQTVILQGSMCHWRVSYQVYLSCYVRPRQQRCFLRFPQSDSSPRSPAVIVGLPPSILVDTYCLAYQGNTIHCHSATHYLPTHNNHCHSFVLP